MSSIIYRSRLNRVASVLGLQPSFRPATGDPSFPVLPGGGAPRRRTLTPPTLSFDPPENVQPVNASQPLAPLVCDPRDTEMPATTEAAEADLIMRTDLPTAPLPPMPEEVNNPINLTRGQIHPLDRSRTVQEQNFHVTGQQGGR